MEADDWFPLAELATRLGSLVWVEEQLADVLKIWSGVEPHAPAAVAFAIAGEHHRWHASTIRGCLPTSPRLRSSEVVQPPTEGWAVASTTLQSLTDAGATAARLKILVKVIDPWLEREVDALLELSRPVSDAAMMRWLRFVAIDHHEDGQGIRELLAARSADAVRFEDHRAVSELDLG